VPGPSPRRPVTAGSAGDPLWSVDGRTLYFTQGGSIHAVDVGVGEDFTFSRLREVVSLSGLGTRGDGNYNTPDYDVAPDGESFVVIRAVEEPSRPTHLKVVVDWLTELRLRVPTGGQR
jgi:hypothetical protein